MAKSRGARALQSVMAKQKGPSITSDNIGILFPLLTSGKSALPKTKKVTKK